MSKVTYRQLISEIKNLPDTWYPALLKIMVESAIDKKAFTVGAIHGFVYDIEHRKMMQRHGHTKPIPPAALTTVMEDSAKGEE